MNEYDSVILSEAFKNLIEFATEITLDLSKSAMDLDSGFDSKENKDLLKSHRIRPVIYPNRRNTKEPIKIARMFRWFDKKTYRQRFKIERSFSWQDVYRKLVVTFDRLPEIRRGCRLLAYSMINYRVTFGGENLE